MAWRFCRTIATSNVRKCNLILNGAVKPIRNGRLQNRLFGSSCIKLTDKAPPGNEQPSPTSTTASTPPAEQEPPTTKPNPERLVKVTIKARPERAKFITKLKAMTEYSLSEQDLQGLAEHKRRSAHMYDTYTTMYYESDVENRAIKVHGGVEAFRKVQRRWKLNQKAANKQMLSYYNFALPPPKEKLFQRLYNGCQSVWKNGRVVSIAVFVNSFNCLGKFAAGMWTGSHSLYAEAVHSLADTINQLVLAFGIYRSAQRPDKQHPYGYMNFTYVTSLASGVAFFCVGCGLNVSHGIYAFYHPEPLQSLFLAYVTLMISLITEGGTLIAAYREIRRSAHAETMTIREYIRRGENPSLNVVFYEDLASVLGVSIAAACLALSSYFNSYIPDACGSILIGGLLGVVAAAIIRTNADHLVGRSMPDREVDDIVTDLENDPIIRSVQDVKTTELGGAQQRFKAEIDINGYEVTKLYLSGQDIDKLLQEVHAIKTHEDLQNFLLLHGEQIVDLVGGQLDRIEKSLKKKHPDVTHVDLEIL